MFFLSTLGLEFSLNVYVDIFYLYLLRYFLLEIYIYKKNSYFCDSKSNFPF